MCDPTQGFPKTIEDDISKAVVLLRASPDLEDQDLYRLLVKQGMECKRAARLLEFLPSVYCRMILENTGVRFSDKFRRGKALLEQALSSDPLWNFVLAFARREVEGGVSPENLLAIAMRSAEFSAANQLMNRGSKLCDLAFTPLVFPWPEDGPDTKERVEK